MESSYQLSKVFQAAFDQLRKNNKKDALDDLIKGWGQLPDTLKKCGQTSLADKLNKLFPAQCNDALENFIIEADVFIHNYDRAEWLYKHAREFYRSIGEVRK